jgi:hypothetical protein
MRTVLTALGALAAAVVLGPADASAQAPIGIVRPPVPSGFGGGGLRGGFGGGGGIGGGIGGGGFRPAAIARPGIGYRPGAFGRPGFGYGDRPGVIGRPGFGRYGGAYRPFYGGYYRRGFGYPRYGYYRRRNHGGALAAGLIGGLAIGSLASYGYGYPAYGYPAYGYGYPYGVASEDCYVVRRRAVGPRGRVWVRRVLVCDY